MNWHERQDFFQSRNPAVVLAIASSLAKPSAGKPGRPCYGAVRQRLKRIGVYESCSICTLLGFGLAGFRSPGKGLLWPMAAVGDRDRQRPALSPRSRLPAGGAGEVNRWCIRIGACNGSTRELPQILLCLALAPLQPTGRSERVGVEARVNRVDGRPGGPRQHMEVACRRLTRTVLCGGEPVAPCLPPSPLAFYTSLCYQSPLQASAG